MAQEYIGYGFAVDDISDEGLLNFVKTQDPDIYREFVKDIYEGEDPDSLTDEDYEDLQTAIWEWIEFTTSEGDVAHYIAATLCSKTCPNLFVSPNGIHVVYPATQFLEDVTEKHRELIKNEIDVQNLICSYFPDEKITFGRIWLHVSDWIEPNYCMD